MKILLAFCALMLSTITYAQSITTGWQLLGASQDINVSNFDGKCIDYVWVYDKSNPTSSKWKLHVANGNSYNYTGNYITYIKKNEGFWVKGNGNCDIDLGDNLVFTQDMVTDKKYYVFYQSISNPSIYAVYSKYFYDGSGLNGDEYGHLYSRNFTIKIVNGKFVQTYTDGSVKYTYNLLRKTADYLEYYEESNETVPQTYIGRMFYNKQDVIEYVKNLEVYNNTFFDGNLTFSNLDVVEYYTPERFNEENIANIINFKKRGNDDNNYSIEDDGIVLHTVSSDGHFSRIQGSLRSKPVFSNGIAVEVLSGELNASDTQQNIRLSMNGYNDGTYDVQPSLRVLKDKVIYNRYYPNPSNGQQNLTNWTTVLDGVNCSNKNIKLALWVKDGLIHFYAKCDGKVGYKTFNISNFSDNSLMDSKWMNFKVVTQDGPGATTAKFKKVYVIR